MGIVFLLVELDLWPKVHIASAMIVVNNGTCTLAHDDSSWHTSIPSSASEPKARELCSRVNGGEPRALEVRARKRELYKFPSCVAGVE